MNQTPTLPLLPENIALAVSVVIAGLYDVSRGGHTGKCRTRHELGAVHQPNPDVACSVAPEDIGFAVTIEIAGSNDRPRRPASTS